MPQIEPFVISIIKQPRPPALSKPWEFKITQGNKVGRTWCATKSEANLRKQEALLIISRCGGGEVR